MICESCDLVILIASHQNFTTEYDINYCLCILFWRLTLWFMMIIIAMTRFV